MRRGTNNSSIIMLCPGLLLRLVSLLVSLLVFADTPVTSIFLHLMSGEADAQEPQLLSYRVLEGVTEPFAGEEGAGGAVTPLWMRMKRAADDKAARRHIQAALGEYGQLLRNPGVFGEMPLQERYDVFLSMSKLLRLMGFHQKAELVLYESLGYSKTPFESHLSLASLFLEKERLDKAKMHLKQCLYLRETDVSSLTHLAVVLIAEGRTHEARFYVTRVQAALLAKIGALLGGPRVEALLHEVDARHNCSHAVRAARYQALTRWLEALLVRVFHGEQQALVPGELHDQYLRFTDLLEWLAAGEMNGRFVFDLGASLVEGGMPEVGALMLRRGHDTSDASEGAVSIAVIKLRIALDFPVVPKSIVEVLDAYLRMTRHFSLQRRGSPPSSPVAGEEEEVDIENTMDLYWVVPLLHYSALPTASILQSLMRRFGPGFSKLGLPDPTSNWADPSAVSKVGGRRGAGRSGRHLVTQLVRLDGEDTTRACLIEVLLVSGHLNDHPVGLTVLHRILALDPRRFRVTVAAYPQLSDAVTDAIKAAAIRFVALPIDTAAAWAVLQRLTVDVALLPDWLPFPDQQSLVFASSRIAPFQVCFFVRGSSCATADIDYYILPSDLQSYWDALQQGTGSAQGVWFRHYAEQVVLVDWNLFTPAVVRGVTAATVTAATAGEKGPSSERDVLYSTQELEGPVFFEDQSVAVVPVDPSTFHPLMDDAILQVLRACPQLTLLLVLHSSFLAHADNANCRISWGRRLARRLWAGDSVLANRIRLLPSIVDGAHLLELLRAADLALDTFPSGGSLQTVALALSVGTPVVTLRSGVRFQRIAAGYDAAAYADILVNGSVPWLPSVSPLAALYLRHNLTVLAARSVPEYVAVAQRIARDKEFGYGLRIRLLDLLDAAAEHGPDHEFGPGDRGDDDFSDTVATTAVSSSEGSKGKRVRVERKQGEDSLFDLERFLERIGAQTSVDRLNS